jgi:hypothetical protein
MTRTVVTVFESELVGKEGVHRELQKLCEAVVKIGDAYSYQPAAGKLFEFIGLIRLRKISYGAHFDTKDC